MKWLEAFISWIKEILSYYDNIEYDNFSMGRTLPSAALAIIGIYIGSVIACIVSLYSKGYLAGFVNRLIDAGATSPEKGLTVTEAGYSKHAVIYTSLTDGKVVRKTVFAAQEEQEGEEPAAKKKTNPRTARFYVPEEKVSAARIRYSKKHTNFFVSIIAVIVLTILAALVYIFLPDIIRMLDNLITIYKNQ